MIQAPSGRQAGLWVLLGDLLPREQGAWAFLLVPALAVLGAWPHCTTVCVVLGFLGLFLLRGFPGRFSRDPARWALTILTVSVFIGLHLQALGHWWEALLPTVLLGPLLLLLEHRGAARGLCFELLAAAFLTLQVPATLFALGAPRSLAWLSGTGAFLPWLPTLAYLRLRVVQAKGDEPESRRRRLQALLLLLAAGLGAACFAVAWPSSGPWVAWNLILGLRTLWAVLCRAQRIPSARQLGFAEIGWSLGTALVVAWTLSIRSWRFGHLG